MHWLRAQVQVNVEPDPEGPLNPYGVGFSARETELQSELAARRRVDPSKSRVWKIKNHNSRNTVTGEPVLSLQHCKAAMHSKAAILMLARWLLPTAVGSHLLKTASHSAHVGAALDML